MNSIDTKLWAREMCLGGIDNEIQDWNDRAQPSWDEMEALHKERNRIARFLKLPELPRFPVNT